MRVSHHNLLGAATRRPTPVRRFTNSVAYAASVLENALQRLSYDARESAFQRCDDILAEFCVWPFGQGVGASAGPVQIGGGQPRKRESGGAGRDSVQELVREVRKEMLTETAGTGPGAGGGQEGEEELCFEVVATVLEIFGRMDSLVSLWLSDFSTPQDLLFGCSVVLGTRADATEGMTKLTTFSCDSSGSLSRWPRSQDSRTQA